MASITALLVATGLLYLGAGQQGIIVPVRAGIEGFSTFTIGMYGAFFAAGFVGGCYIVPWMLRRVGHVRSFSVVAALGAVSILLQDLLIQEYVWLIFRLITGFALAGSAMIVESWLNERATNETRGIIFSIYMAVNLSFTTAGQLSLMVLDPSTSLMFMSGAVCFCLALVPTSLSISPPPSPPGGVKIDLLWLYRMSPVAAVGAFGVGLVYGAFGSLAPVFATDVGLSYQDVAIFMSLTLLAGALSQIVVGRISDRVDRRLAISCTAIAGAIAGIAMVMFAEPGMTIFLLVAAFGGAAYSIYGVAVAHANDHAEPHEFVGVASGLLLLLGIGQIVGPIIAAAIAEFSSTASIFIFTAAVHLLIAGFALYRTSQRHAVPDEEKAGYVDYGQGVSPEAVSLDPRSDESAESGGGGDGGGSGGGAMPQPAMAR